MDPKRKESLTSYASSLVAQHGHRNGNPSWDHIVEMWDGDGELTQEELDFVYQLWSTARVSVSWLEPN